MIDQPEVIERARQAIAQRADEVRRHRTETQRWPSAAGAVSGYLDALRDNGLIGIDVYYELKGEADKAVVAALSADC
ncbi:hypothetical protein FYM84_26950 [Pseudomonas sp. CAH-1]|uniref:hypothetical protein n=1 Tax=Pseudomonas sp. CAH-1 TaxID=2605744 RepID=UPI0012AE7140|nr:hypothetical protein [Pseudomonas sp. CAH-1]MRT64173.1 hypothetical protein [Pseudomonas sp. CAH-1]WHH53181.1 hypothetical protein QFA96_26895 [Pseudomonas sp. Ap32]